MKSNRCRFLRRFANVQREFLAAELHAQARQTVLPIRCLQLITFDLRESMENGGGPACLRLRVGLTSVERAAIDARVFLDEKLADELANWIRRNYRDRIAPSDLADPALIDESRRTLDELTRILRLPSIYPFQLA